MWSGPRILLMACCALGAACGGPTKPSSSALDGQWSGTTAQGTPIAFTVSADQKVTSITVGYNFGGCSGTQTFANLSLDTVPNVICVPGPCATPIDSFRGFNYLSGSLDGPSTTVNALFSATTLAEGQVAFRGFPGCGAASAGWTATKH
jgi:hypothetical protein